jgi:DNA-binding transcriptional LysR family regulator
MDRLDAMGVFLAVVESGSFSGAGRRLAMPLATVSRNVSELEAHLKARLLNRSTRRLSLTDAGRDYLTACKRILEDVSEAERVASGEFTAPRGELVIAAPIVFGRLHVLPVIADFLKAFPEVDVRMAQSDRIADLLEDHIDLAVRVGNLPDSSLSATRVAMTRRVACASPAYFHEHGIPATPQQLATHRCISFDALGSAHSWSFVEGSAQLTVPLHSRLVVNTAEAAIDAAIAGVGITRVLSYQIDAPRRSGLLELALQEFEPAPVPVSLVYSRQRRLPLKLRAFLDFAAPRLRERMQSAE